MTYPSDFEHNNPWHWIKIGIDWGYCNPTIAIQEALWCKNWCFFDLYIEFIFHLILMGLFFNEFHKKNPFQKNAVLLYKYYHFGIKGTKKDFISVWFWWCFFFSPVQSELLPPDGITFHISIFSSKTTESNWTKLVWECPWLVHFQNCVWQPCPQFKMVAATKNVNFFTCLFLLYYNSKWAQILSAATWHYGFFCKIFSFSR